MNIQIRNIKLRLKRPFRLSRGVSEERENVIVEIDGHFGEGAPLYYLNQTGDEIALSAQAIIDALPSDNDFAYLQENAWPKDMSCYPKPALCAVSQAVYGYLAYNANQPLYRYLGLPEPKNAATSFSIGITRPDQLEDIFAENPGYKSYKLKMGSDDDIEVVKKFRELSDAELRIDVNGGWKFSEAVEKLKELEKYNIEFVEQPLPTGSLKELDDLAAGTDIPIFADEDLNNFSDIMSLNGIVRGINVKLSKCGSIFDSIRIMQYAKQVGMKVLLGCMVESSVGITAAIHLTALADYIDLDGNILINNDPFKGAITGNGLMTLPDGNGLGVQPR